MPQALPPGLAGFIQSQQDAQQRNAGMLQQAGTLAQLQEMMAKRQDDESIKAALSNSGGDIFKAQQALISSGSPKGITLAAQLQAAFAKPQGQSIGSGGLRLPSGEIIPPAARLEGERPQPIGSGGLRLPSGEIVPPAAKPKDTTQEPLHPIIGPDGQPVLVPRSQAVGKTPYNASIAGAGQFTPEALRLTAEQYLAGDRQAIQGYARNANARLALQNEITKVAKERGWKGSDIAAQMADFTGIISGSRTVGQRAANIELASNEADKMIDIVLDKSKGFERTQFVPVNTALKAFETQTGQPEVKAFGAAINSLVNVYARAISPSGVPTVADKEHARDMLKQADSPAQVQAVMDVMRQEMRAARGAPLDVRAATRRAVTGGAEQPAPPPAAPATGGWSIVR